MAEHQQQQQQQSRIKLSQQNDTAELLRADELLAALPEEYFPNVYDQTKSSTPQCRCHLQRAPQQARRPLQHSYSPSSISYSCSSLLSFSDSTADDLSDDDEVKKDCLRLRRIRKEEAQLRSLLNELDERLARLQQGAPGSDQARMLFSLRRMSVERLLGALASSAGAKEEKLASCKKQRQDSQVKSARSCDGESDRSDDSDSWHDF